MLYQCTFDLDVLQWDKATDGKYLPIEDLTGKIQNIKHWEEMVARKGKKFRYDSVLSPPPGRSRPDTWVTSRFSNGRRYWDYMSDNGVANEFEDFDQRAMPPSDFYGDMIGFPLRTLARGARTVAGDSKEPFELDQLIPTGKYEVIGEERIGDDACIVLSRPELDRLWLSPTKGWAIVKREWSWGLGGPLKRRITNRDFRSTALEVWFPFKSDMEFFGHPSTRPNQLIAILHATISDVKIQIDDDWFEPFFPKGTKVSNVTTRTIYRWNMAKEDLDAMVGRASQLKAFSSGPLQPTPRRMLPYIIAGSVMLVLIVVLYLMIKMRGKAGP